MTRNRFVVSVALSLLCAIAIVVLAADRKPIPAPSAPKDVTFTSLRAVRYCEVWLFKGTPETGIAGVYFNTSNLNNSADKMDTCPANMWDKVTVKSLESQYDVPAAYKNGPRGWTMDTITIPVGPVMAFDGLKTRWWGQAVLPKGVTLKGGAHPVPYQPLKSHRKSTFTFLKGKPAFILQDPEGTPWVMQAWGQLVDTSLTYDGLKDLGSKLKLPAGWKYRVAVIDKDLVISTPQGFNWILQDKLQNTYDACKEGACNYQP
jgi:hypothetical protein